MRLYVLVLVSVVESVRPGSRPTCDVGRQKSPLPADFSPWELAFLRQSIDRFHVQSKELRNFRGSEKHIGHNGPLTQDPAMEKSVNTSKNPLSRCFIGNHR